MECNSTDVMDMKLKKILIVQLLGIITITAATLRNLHSFCAADPKSESQSESQAARVCPVRGKTYVLVRTYKGLSVASCC